MRMRIAEKDQGLPFILKQLMLYYCVCNVCELIIAFLHAFYTQKLLQNIKGVGLKMPLSAIRGNERGVTNNNVQRSASSSAV